MRVTFLFLHLYLRISIYFIMYLVNLFQYVSRDSRYASPSFCLPGRGRCLPCRSTLEAGADDSSDDDEQDLVAARASAKRSFDAELQLALIRDQSPWVVVRPQELKLCHLHMPGVHVRARVRR